MKTAANIYMTKQYKQRIKITPSSMAREQVRGEEMGKTVEDFCISCFSSYCEKLAKKAT